MKADQGLSVLRKVNRLKLVPRTGWMLRGVQPAESVAEHTYGVALTALLLADLIDEPVDRERLLILSLLHDLAESITGDIPRPAGLLFPPTVKKSIEERALASLLESWPDGERYLALWHEYEDGSTVEGRLMGDADRLELLIQADAYEQVGARGLDEFWEELSADQFAYEATWRLVQQLVAERQAEVKEP